MLYFYRRLASVVCNVITTANFSTTGLPDNIIYKKVNKLVYNF